MDTLRKGSKGDQVILLQRELNRIGYKLVEDGDFGAKTESAVKDFQRKNNLVQDGIVGRNTWSALGVREDNSKLELIHCPTTCVTKKANRTVKYIAIHYTAGASSAPGRAKSMKNTWEKNRNASADFGVDDRDIVQFNPDLKNYYCWSVGDKKNPYGGGGRLYGTATNSNTISIEICSNLKKGYSASKVNHEGWYYTEDSLNNAVKLVKILMKKFNVPIDRVVRHYDISGKICPGIVGWNNYELADKDGNKLGKKNNSNKWEEFKQRLLR